MEAMTEGPASEGCTTVGDLKIGMSGW